MAYDFRANQVRLNRIISSGSIPILIYPSSSAADFAGNLKPSFSTAAIGSDVFLYVSGSSTAKTVFGGDALTSGSFRSLAGITGSIQYTDASNTSFIVGGSDIIVNYNSLGQWEISGSEPGFFSSPSNSVVRTTGSFEATYLSASTGAQITGSLQVLGGITGSLSGTTAGNPFIIAGPNVTIKYNTLGQWEVSSSGGSSLWTELNASTIYTTSSIQVARLSASFGAIITGSVVQGVSCTAINNSHAEGYQTDVSAGNYGHAEGYQTDVTADGAHAEGSNTTAAGQYSHAEGLNTNTDINGNGSHAEGRETLAYGIASHAEGRSTQANGEYSHAEGYSAIAGSDYSHAEGLSTYAGGEYSHVEGFANATYANGSHAEGNGTQAHALYSHAEGRDTRTYGASSHAEGWGSEAYGTGSLAAGLYTIASGAVDGASPPTTIQAAFGKYNLPNNTSSLFVVGDGLDVNNRHDVLRVNSGSVEVTGSFIATGITGSVSGTVAGNPFIIAGPNTTTKYNSLGQWEISSSGGGGGGSNYWVSDVNNIIYTTGSAYATVLSASVGLNVSGTIVLGTVGTSYAGTNAATGTGAFVLGARSLASGIGSIANGYAVTSSGNTSHAEGETTNANGVSSHAEGSGTTTVGRASHSEGWGSTANGDYSHAEGEGCQAGTSVINGQASHAEGYYSIATGNHSHAEGYNTKAIGNASHTGGSYTIASGSYQTVYGNYNKRNNNFSLFVIGNGTGDADNLRSDIVRVNTNAVEVTGSLFVTQTMSASIVSASYVRANNIDITPVTAQLIIGGDNVNRASGSISGLFESGSLMTPGSIGKFDIEVLAMDYNFETGASWKYTITALWPYSGNFTILASTEIAAEYGPIAGSYNPSNDWDVNFNNLGQIELTGSIPAFPMGGTSFYVQVTKKMIGTYASIIA